MDRRRRERRAQSDANRPGATFVEARIGIARHIELVAVYGDGATRIEPAVIIIKRNNMGRGVLLWLLGVPIPIIILLALFWR